MAQLYNNPSSETTNDHATLQFGVNGGSHNRVNTISAVAESAGNRKLAFAFCTDEAGSRSEKMRITGDGFVGVGTYSPANWLHVENGGDAGNTYIHVQNSHSGGGNAGVKMQNVNGEWTIIANDRLRIIDDDSSQDALTIEKPDASNASNRCIRHFGSGATGGSFTAASTTGAFNVVVRNLAVVNGNNWRPAQLWVLWRGIKGDASANNRSLTYVRLAGLSVWSSASTDTIEGSDLSPTIDSATDTTTSCNVGFTVPGTNTTGTVYVWASCWNAAPTVEILG